LGVLAVSGVRSPERERYFTRGFDERLKSAEQIQSAEMAGQNTLYHKPPKTFMGEQIKHLVSGSSF
jgi:hypothetical protein